MTKILLVLLISLFLTSCNNIDNLDSVEVGKDIPINEVLAIEEIIEEKVIINKDATTIKDRYSAPIDFERTDVEGNSIGEF